jgi:tRNA-splicing ligase RtcB (3'-phosphate/5'-hydroxy nucleic acid ligase)
MSESRQAGLKSWLTQPLAPEIVQSVDRLRQMDDVQHVALMPDVHLAQDVCIGAVVATRQVIYPAAVGGDIGCGMAALAFDVAASSIDNEQAAGTILKGLYEFVPGNKHRQPRDLPAELESLPLSDSRLRRIAQRDGRVQLGTLGRGNHFLELQADQDGRLWVLIHSGSRAMGQAITAHHVKNACHSSHGDTNLIASDDSGRNYLADVEWARTYARENRLAMLRAVEQLMQQSFGILADWSSLIHCDHNHVQQEKHFGELFWIHRKGAQSARVDEPGIIPGSMGSASFHTRGRGYEDALMSCSHGAGRKLSRSEACRSVSEKSFARQLGDVWYDHRRSAKLRDEAPAAYKDIGAVMRAQRDLVRIEQQLRPVLSYKGR